MSSGILSNIQKIPFAFGGAALSGEGEGYGFGPITENESIELLQFALSCGVTIYDTAPIYGFHESEKRIGKAFRLDRDQVFIISKSGVTWNDHKRVDMTNRPEVAAKMLDDTLRALQFDFVDLYMVHWPDQIVDIRKVLEVYVKEQQRGHIKHIGLCNTHAADIAKAQEVCKIDVIQSEFNLFNQSAAELSDEIKKLNASFMSWGTLDKGILTQRVHSKRTFDQSDCRSWAPWWKAQNLKLKISKVEVLKTILDEYHYSLLQFAVSFNLSQNFLTTIICGAKNKNELTSILEAIKNKIPSEKVREICNRFEETVKNKGLS